MKKILSLFVALVALTSLYAQTSFSSLETTGTNPISTTNGFFNMLQFKNPFHAAIVYEPGTAQELMFGFHSNGSFYWGTGLNAGSYYSMSLSKDGDLHAKRTLSIGNNYFNVRENGYVGIGVSEPASMLDIRGNITIDNGANPVVYTGISSQESNRFLQLLNSPIHSSASGLMAGGILISDSYAYANPGKNDLVVKGSVSIGATNSQGYKLAVSGNMIAESIKVALQTSWPDYVFKPDHKLPSLTEVETFIKTNKHLPEIPSAAEVEKDGIDLGEMNAKLLKKIEELTLYLIEQDKKFEKKLAEQQEEINKLKRK